MSEAEVPIEVARAGETPSTSGVSSREVPSDNRAVRACIALFVVIHVIAVAGWLGSRGSVSKQSPDDLRAEAPLPGSVTREAARRVEHWFHALRFDGARRELESILALPLAPEDRAMLEARVRRLERQGALLDALVASPRLAQEGPDIGIATLASGGKIVRVDHQGIALIETPPNARPGLPPEGARRVVDVDWCAVDAWSCWLLLSRVVTTFEGWQDLAGLLEDLGRPQVALNAWIQAFKRYPERREVVSREVARLRGEPDGAYALVADQLVRVEDVPHIERGLVCWRKRWVTPGDFARLAERKELRDGQWVELTDDELRARGDVHDSELGWVTPAELVTLQARWEHAWSRQTATWLIRTNAGYAVLQRLERALEALTPLLRGRFGPLVSGAAPLGVLAFREPESFRARAAEARVGLEAWLELGGMLVGRDAGCVVGKDGDDLPAVLAMASRAYYRHSAAAHAHPSPAPRWIEEALAAEVGAWTVSVDGSLGPSGASWIRALDAWDASRPALSSTTGGPDPLAPLRLRARAWCELERVLRERPPRAWRGPDGRLAGWTELRERGAGPEGAR